MDRKLFIVGCLFAVTAVILGALAAHALENVLNSKQLDSFNTGVRYQMYHALALLIIANARIVQERNKKVVLILWSSGIFLFSISIYVLNLTAAMGSTWSFLGPITPIGGLLLISGWCYLLWIIISHNKPKS